MRDSRLTALQESKLDPSGMTGLFLSQKSEL